ncbi:MAG: hypothetical protein ACREK3_04250, partial [Gemmatimonadota bacterium]
MLRDRASRAAFALALLVHALAVAPVWGRLDLVPAKAERTPADEPPLRFTFVEAPEAPEEAPEEPTPLVSTRDSRAAQPSAPERPEGEAYQEGRTAIPQRPRPAGSPAQPGAVASATAGEPESREPQPAAAPSHEPAGMAPVRPGLGSVLQRGASPGDRLPAPETDQRATRARAGSSYSLNTTAWEFGPYMERLKRRIERHVFPPPAFYYGTAAWATRVKFRIAPDGRLASLELLDHRGVRNLQHVALSAIEGAADYEPLP